MKKTLLVLAFTGMCCFAGIKKIKLPNANTLQQKLYRNGFAYIGKPTDICKKLGGSEMYADILVLNVIESLKQFTHPQITLGKNWGNILEALLDGDPEAFAEAKIEIENENKRMEEKEPARTAEESKQLSNVND